MNLVQAQDIQLRGDCSAISLSLFRAIFHFGMTISHMRYEGVYSLNLLYGDAYPSLVTHLESDFLWPNALSKS